MEPGIRMARPYINKDAKEGVLSKAKGLSGDGVRSRDIPAMAGSTFHERWEGKNEGSR